jgi:hypothetical protein
MHAYMFPYAPDVEGNCRISLLWSVFLSRDQLYILLIAFYYVIL